MAQDVYKDILMEHNISPTRIQNVDISNSFIAQKTGAGREQVAAVCPWIHTDIIYPQLLFSQAKTGKMSSLTVPL